MSDQAKIREIRRQLTAIAPLPEEGDVTAEQLARHLAVRAQERWSRQIGYPGDPIDNLQLSCLLAEFAAAHALATLFEADPKMANWAAVQIRDAFEDGGSVGEWLWELLGGKTVEKVSKLVGGLIAAQAVTPDD